MNSTPFFLRLASLAVLLAALVGTAHGAGIQDSSDVVGEATLVIGVANVVSADGKVRVVDRGTAIRVGDRIETAAGGHVHLRFVDGGRLSVRPLSRLAVENYSRAGEQVASTAIKFRLDEGVVRSITGAWGEAARERFRLNTPVAAIGVKGTDFVVKSDADNTLASVYTGAIMLTPLASLGCLASLGPCQNGSEKLLSEDMKGQMLSLSRLQASPQVVPGVDLLAQHVRPVMLDAGPKPDYALKTDGNPPGGGRNDLVVEKIVVSESRAVDIMASQAASAAQAVQAAAPVIAVQPVVPVLPVVPVAPPVALVPPVVPVQLPPEVNQLMWSRLAAVAADGDTLSRSFAEAIQNGRQGTVGNGAFSLYRAVAGTAPAVLASADAQANFRLAASAAQLIWPEGRGTASEVVQVDKGTLNVDFARATYATQLSVSSTRIGIDSVVSNGVIKPNGVFLGQGGNAYTAGALSLDGKEAGYFFDKAVAAGQLSGITLWGR